MKLTKALTPEQYIPDSGMADLDLETCMTLNNTWGYSVHPHLALTNKPAFLLNPP